MIVPYSAISALRARRITLKLKAQRVIKALAARRAIPALMARPVIAARLAKIIIVTLAALSSLLLFACATNPYSAHPQSGRCFEILSVAECSNILSASELGALRSYALDLINRDRAAHGMRALQLGQNNAAQLHAEDALLHGYIGYGYSDGRKPYMLYSHSGGRSYISAHGASSGWTARQWQKEGCALRERACGIPDPREAIQSMHARLIYPNGAQREERRATILRDDHRSVNLGIAFNGRRLTYFQHFEGGDIEFSSPPLLNAEGILTIALTKRDPSITIYPAITLYYEQPSPPPPFTDLQRLRHYCIGNGFSERCNDRILSYLFHTLYLFDYRHFVITKPFPTARFRNAPHRSASSWIESPTSLRISADIARATQRPGIYTIVIEGAYGSPERDATYAIYSFRKE